MGFYQIDARSDYLTIIIGVALGVYSAARQYKFPTGLLPGIPISSILFLPRGILRGAAGSDRH